MVDGNTKMEAWARLRKGQIRSRVFWADAVSKHQLKPYSVQSLALHY